MNIRRKFLGVSKPIVVSTIMLFALALGAGAGSLTPPGLPGSTMHTLEEIYNSIAGIFNSSAIVADQNGSLIQHLKYIEANMGTGSGVSSDSLNFDELADSLALDADTTITNNGFALTFQNASVSNNFEIDGIASVGVLFGAGLTNCTGKLLWSNGLFSCGVDQSGSAGVTSDSLDFDEFVDNMNLDASTNVAQAGFNYTFTGTGNVGIGTSSPTAKLMIANFPANLTGQIIRVAPSQASNSFEIQNSAGAFMTGVKNDGTLKIGAGNNMEITTTGQINYLNTAGYIRFGGASFEIFPGNYNLLHFNAMLSQIRATTYADIATNNPLFFDIRATAAAGGAATGGYTGLNVDVTETGPVLTGNRFLANFKSTGVSRFSVLANGNVGIGTTTANYRLAVAGTASVSGGFFGSGLADCDTGATSKLLWDATTGMFSCGTDETGGGGGAVTSDSLDFDEFVDNMNLDANTSVANNGFALTFQNASVSSNLEISGRASASAYGGSSLPNCSAVGDKLLYNSTTGQFSCGSDAQGAGSAGGWTDDGSVVRLTTAADYVGIGTTVIDSGTTGMKLEVVGLASISAAVILPGPLGKVGIGLGATLPTSKLHIQGTTGAAFTESLVSIGSASGTVGFAINGNGSFTVGFRSPTLHYNRIDSGAGTLTSHALTASSDLLLTGKLEVDSVTYLDAGASVSGNMQLTGKYRTSDFGTAPLPSWVLYSGAPTTGFYTPTNNIIGFSTAGVEAMRLDAAGNMGLGITTTSGIRLSVTGTGAGAIANFASASTVSSLYLHKNGSVGIHNTFPTATLHVTSLVSTNATQQDFVVENSATQDQFIIYNRGDMFLAGSASVSGNIESLGFVKVPDGSAAIPSFTFSNSPATGIYSTAFNVLSFSTAGTEAMRITALGNVGIGETAPAARLDVKGAAGNNPIANFASASGTSALRITKNSLVGIGTTFPGHLLDVEGALEIGLPGTATSFALCHTTSTGTTNQEVVDCTGTPSADYMEMYPTDSSINAGDIVMADEHRFANTTQGGRVATLVKADAAHRSQVLGIISNVAEAGEFNSIGHNINASDHPQPLALSGRVRVNVTNENGAIKVGDPISISSTPGVGAKATSAGMIVGLALEPSSGGGTQPLLVYVGPRYWAPEVPKGELQIGDEDGKLFGSVIKQLAKTFHVVIEDGLIKTIRGVFGTVQTDKLCIQDVCVDRDQLKEMLQKNDLTLKLSATPSPTPDGEVRKKSKK